MPKTLCMLARQPFISHCLGKLLCLSERGNEPCALNQPALLCPCMALCAQISSKTHPQPAQGCSSWGCCHRALREVLSSGKASRPLLSLPAHHLRFLYIPLRQGGKRPLLSRMNGALGTSDTEVEIMPSPTILIGFLHWDEMCFPVFNVFIKLAYMIYHVLNY